MYTRNKAEDKKARFKKKSKKPNSLQRKKVKTKLSSRKRKKSFKILHFSLIYIPTFWVISQSKTIKTKLSHASQSVLNVILIFSIKSTSITVSEKKEHLTILLSTIFPYSLMAISPYSIPHFKRAGIVFSQNFICQ